MVAMAVEAPPRAGGRLGPTRHGRTQLVDLSPFMAWGARQWAQNGRFDLLSASAWVRICRAIPNELGSGGILRSRRLQ